jgi:hypothetical protein
MTHEQLADLKNDAILRKRLAKKMAHDFFRNTNELEDMHAAGKLSDDDMKALMTEISERIYGDHNLLIVDRTALDHSCVPISRCLSCVVL